MRFSILGFAAFVCCASAHESQITSTTTTTTTTTTTSTTTVTEACSSSSTSPAPSLSPSSTMTANTVSTISSSASSIHTNGTLGTSQGASMSPFTDKCTAVASPPASTVTNVITLASNATTTRVITLEGPYCACGTHMAGMSVDTTSGTAYTWCAVSPSQTVGSSVIVDATAPAQTSTSQASHIPSLTAPSRSSNTPTNDTGFTATASPPAQQTTSAATRMGAGIAGALVLGGMGVAFGLV